MAKKSTKLSASSKVVDPTLDALFSTSSGPVQPRPKARYNEPRPSRTKPKGQDAEEKDEDESVVDAAGRASLSDDENKDDDLVSNDAELSELSSAEEEAESDDAAPEPLFEASKKRDRKRKRKDDDDLEGKYLEKLAQIEEKEHAREKRQRKEAAAEAAAADDDSDQDSTSAPAKQTSADEGETKNEDDTSIPLHETLAKKSDTNGSDSRSQDIDKANRTVYLGNVAAEASSSKSARRALEKHLSTVLSDGEKIESIRFRSLAFADNKIPKRAAYITGSLKDATTKSANAYAVYSSARAARRAFAELNGTMVLDRHLRVDSVAHPSPVDHFRCVFVGNLALVDDETVLNATATGQTKERKRNKVPADVEEGLWQVFGQHAGKVENVRVVRDPKTRVGKGIAYVQFYDANDVESALLVDSKAFPPMLPRALRVSRAKPPHKTALALERSQAKKASAATDAKPLKYKPKPTSEELSMSGRTSKLLGRAASFAERGGGGKTGGRAGKRIGRRTRPAVPDGVVPKGPEHFVFEGKRASANDGRPNDLRLGKVRAKGGNGRADSRRRRGGLSGGGGRKRKAE